MNKYIKKNKLKQFKKGKQSLTVIRDDVAGIDLGSKSHFVATSNPENEKEVFIREFSVLTFGLKDCIAWLKKCKVKSVVMEATGVYWMHFYTMLEEEGFEVVLANSRHVKNVKGKKTDILDAEWLMQLHSYGLLEGAFIPEPQVVELRTYVREREKSVRKASESIQRMQKAMIRMNLRLDNVISDISGKTGINIIKEILAGERDPKILAKNRDPRCRKPEEDIEKALEGCYRDDLVFSLEKAFNEWTFHVKDIRNCESRIQSHLNKFEEKMTSEKIEKTKKSANIKERKRQSGSHSRIHQFTFDVRTEIMKMCGVDIMALPTVGETTALTLISEIGTDMSSWPSVKHFCSWLKLSPNNQVSGGKTQRNTNRKKSTAASRALRMAVSGLYREENPTALGVFFRHQKTKKGPKFATTAAAHKLAKMYYNLMKTGKAFVEPGAEAYLELQKQKRIRNMRAQLNKWGYTVNQKVQPQTSLNQ